ncbi:peptidoglycan editing factor PgeF [Halobacillus fulvus]|nr:peptidoglycan editing factor PgeF [Halobacillus fulvus]
MKEPFKHESMRQLTCFHDEPTLVAGITTRQGGVSEAPFESLNMGLHVNDSQEVVVANRKLLADEVGIPLDRWVIGEQVHDIRVQEVVPSDFGKGVYNHGEALKGIDGLITNQPDVLLTAFYADCVPLFFYDPTTKWIGVAHAGWKGTVKGMAREMTEQLVKKGASPEDLKMVIGPCITKRHYEVDKRVMDHIPDVYKSKVSERTQDDHFLLDLKELNRLVALDAGLDDENIHISDYCTYEEEALLYSHRRDQGKTGRMLGFIGWSS